MDLLHDPEVRVKYEKCKYKVKVWEHNFRKDFGRLPSKLDIREADDEVRNAYKVYFRLKTAALEESLTNIEGFDTETDITTNSQPIIEKPPDSTPKKAANVKQTWGPHLNKDHVNSSNNKEKTQEKSQVNLSFTQKLFEGSKSSKRLPRKSLSFNRKKSETDTSKIQFFSQPECSTSFSDISHIEVEPETQTSQDSTKTFISSAPLKIIQNVIHSNYRPVRNLDIGWINRVTDSTSISESLVNDSNVSKLDYNSDDIIDNSEDELDNSVYHIAKKLKPSQSLNEDKKITSEEKPLITVDIAPKRLDFSNIFNGKTTVEEETNNKSEDVYDFQILEKSESQTKEKKKSRKQPVRTVSETKEKKTSKKQPVRTVSNKKVKKVTPVKDTEDIIPKPKPKRKSRMAEELSLEEAPNKEIPCEKYELEYSVKPRIVTVPRIKNIKQAVMKQNKIKGANEKTNSTGGAEKKLQEKVEKGTLNDNYVQLNLKKKIYVRGKNTRTFSKFKKQQWKNKKNALYGPDMDMRGCDGGMLTCFSCGEIGHFARACKKAKGDGLLPLQEEEEVCPYPTLEEAAKMAQESVLAIRKPIQTHTDIENIADVLEKANVESEDAILFDDEFDEALILETERLEVEIAKINVQNYIDSTVSVKPYYALNEDGSLIETPEELYKTLEKFGHETFRDGQEQAIMRILSGKSTLVTLSTGSGKSLCYQLPAYMFSQREPCISLIISPLVSLMEDQVTGIPDFLKAACLHTNQTKVQREKIMEAIRSGNIHILLVSPEAVVAGEKSTGFGSLLRQLPPIAFACIDEAHCVSQWSHNFRPSYLKICRVLRDRLGVNIILGLTATATRATSDSIIEHLHIPDGRHGIISDTPLPDNLKLTVSKDEQRDRALLALLLSERFADCRSIIIYCTRREECQRVATFLRTYFKDDPVVGDHTNKKRKRLNVQAETYHAGMSAARRKSIQKSFMSGELRIVVATVAFGMGINKSDIRSVIHYNMPMSFESYVQEVGRAGRDGLPAHCHLFLDSQGKDQDELNRHIYGHSIDRHVIRKLLQSCFMRCSCKRTCPRHEVAFSIENTVRALDIPEENIETLLCYLELHNKKYIELLSHAYITCKVISYGGANHIRKAAKDCPPLAMALALYQKQDEQKGNIFEFPVIDVASAMGWDSGICKHKLKNLEWITENNQPKRSKLSVQFTNLGFRLLAPGNLSDVELDEALDSLFDRVKEQERTAVLQLHAVHSTLKSVACPSFTKCISDTEITEHEKLLKTKIREYFESAKPLDLLPELTSKPIIQDQILGDIRSLVFMYRDNAFTGRAVARIFHGIQSPNYPAVIWGRCKFWRAHLGSDFNSICQIATKELLNMRQC